MRKKQGIPCTPFLGVFHTPGETGTGFPDGPVLKNPPAKAEDAGDTGSIPGSERSSEEGNGNPLWYSCLGNPMEGGA